MRQLVLAMASRDLATVFSPLPITLWVEGLLIRKTRHEQVVARRRSARSRVMEPYAHHILRSAEIALASRRDPCIK